MRAEREYDDVFDEYEREQQPFIVEEKMGPLGLRPTTIRRTEAEKRYMDEYYRNRPAGRNGRDPTGWSGVPKERMQPREAVLCPYCRNPVTSQNRSLRCIKCDSFFCAICEEDFREKRKKGEPILCAKCFSKHKKKPSSAVEKKGKKKEHAFSYSLSAPGEQKKRKNEWLASAVVATARKIEDADEENSLHEVVVEAVLLTEKEADALGVQEKEEEKKEEKDAFEVLAEKFESGELTSEEYEKGIEELLNQG